MSREPLRGPGERIVQVCIGALACAICLSLSVELLHSLWPWLLGATTAAGLVALVAWRFRRW